MIIEFHNTPNRFSLPVRAQVAAKIMRYGVHKEMSKIVIDTALLRDHTTPNVFISSAQGTKEHLAEIVKAWWQIQMQRCWRIRASWATE